MRYQNFITHTDHGLMLINKGDRIIGRHLSEKGGWETQYINLLSKLLAAHYPPGEVLDIVDGGANLGVYSLSLSRLAGFAVRVHAVEVQRLIFQILNANVAMNNLGNVWTHHAALSDTVGEIEIRLPEIDQVANFGAFEVSKDVRFSDFDGEKLGPQERVRTITIDSLRMERCALLKLDVEGMEDKAIKGGLRTIERDRPIIVFERHKTDYEAALGHLKEFGYNAWEISDYNVIAMRKEWNVTINPSRKIEL